MSDAVARVIAASSNEAGGTATKMKAAGFDAIGRAMARL
jgi:hypothetical protein